MNYTIQGLIHLLRMVFTSLRNLFFLLMGFEVVSDDHFGKFFLTAKGDFFSDGGELVKLLWGEVSLQSFRGFVFSHNAKIIFFNKN
jgi:hypothetical protein